MSSPRGCLRAMWRLGLWLFRNLWLLAQRGQLKTGGGLVLPFSRIIPPLGSSCTPHSEPLRESRLPYSLLQLLARTQCPPPHPTPRPHCCSRVSGALCPFLAQPGSFTPHPSLVEDRWESSSVVTERVTSKVESSEWQFPGFS